MASIEYFRSIGLFRAPILTVGHKWVGVAALLGACFVIAHMVTVIVTCAVDGFNWGVNAWVLDTLGFVAGFYFAIQCWISSSRRSVDFRKGNLWICVWALATGGARILDALMLFGVVRWGAVYVSPVGPTLWANIVSEVVIGSAFTTTALVGTSMLLVCPRDGDSAQIVTNEAKCAL